MLPKVGILLGIGCGIVLGCREKHAAGPAPVDAIISGSSMEPTLLGPQRMARCNTCQSSLRFSADSANSDFPVPCPRCGQEVSWEGLEEGQSVKIRPIGRSTTGIRRGDVIAFRDPDSGKLEVKRVVGLPNEHVRIEEGDLWVDGVRFQKSFEQFRSLAIIVDRWSGLEGQHSVGIEHADEEQLFESFSLWPRTSELLTPFASPILDEYRSNAMESRELVPVRDIGLKIVLSEPESAPVTMVVRIWFCGAPRCITIAITPDRIRVPLISQGDGQDTHAEIRWTPDNRQVGRTLMVAFVDGRLLIGSDRFGRALEIRDIRSDDRLLPSECSPSKPISLRMLQGRLSILQAFVVRDIHYRGWNGEDEFRLPAVAGYRLLGDNVSNSADSRQRWPEGIPSESIIGRIVSDD